MSDFFFNLQQSVWPRGKVLGGSSRLNYMAYVPGHPKDYTWFPDYSGTDGKWYFSH